MGLFQSEAENFRNLSDVAVGYAAMLDPNHIIFQGGLHVKVLGKLGQGGMGGAVFLAQDGDQRQTGQRRQHW